MSHVEGAHYLASVQLNATELKAQTCHTSKTRSYGATQLLLHQAVSDLSIAQAVPGLSTTQAVY